MTIEPKERRMKALAVLQGCSTQIPHKHESRKHEMMQSRRDKNHVTGEKWSQCAKKASYSSRRMAERVASRIKAERGVELRVYQCDFCNGYHLSKNIRANGTETH